MRRKQITNAKEYFIFVHEIKVNTVKHAGNYKIDWAEVCRRAPVAISKELIIVMGTNTRPSNGLVFQLALIGAEYKEVKKFINCNRKQFKNISNYNFVGVDKNELITEVAKIDNFEERIDYVFNDLELVETHKSIDTVKIKQAFSENEPVNDNKEETNVDSEFGVEEESEIIEKGDGHEEDVNALEDEENVKEKKNSIITFKELEKLIVVNDSYVDPRKMSLLNEIIELVIKRQLNVEEV